MENLKPQPRTTKCAAVLCERGDFIRLRNLPDEEKPRTSEVGGYNFYRYRNPHEWAEKAKEVLGRMHFTDCDALLYPTVPGFEAFARAVSVSHEPRAVEKTSYVLTDEELPAEEVLQRLVASLSADQKAISAAKSELDRQLRIGLEKEDILTVPESATVTLNSVVEGIFDQMNSALIGFAKVNAKGLKVIHRRRTSVPEMEYVPRIVFTFPNGLEVHMEGECAKLFENLLPLIERIKTNIECVRRWRNTGVEERERDYEWQGKHEPMEHQWITYKCHMLLPKLADLSVMGTGKTYAVLMAVDKRIQQGDVRRGHVLVVCPNTIIENWILGEAATHTPHLVFRAITGSYGQRYEQINNRADVDVFICNFETFSMKQPITIGNNEVEVPLAAWFSMVAWDMIIIDEAHKIKNPEAIRTQNILKAVSDAPYKIIMSGTINANKLYDIHAPFCFLNGAKHFNSLHVSRDGRETFTLTKKLEQFKSAYFNVRGYNCTPKSYTIDELRQRMEETSVRFEKKDCFELPDKVYQQRMIEMGDRQRQLYVALKTFLAARLQDIAAEGGTVTIMSVLAMMVKLAEAANGWIYDDNHELIELPENPKLEALEDVLEDLGEDDKVVIWSRFVHDLHTIYDKLCKTYGNEAVAIMHGGESCPRCDSLKTDRWQLTQRFNDLKNPLRFIVVNPAVGSHGLNMTGATYEVFYSNSFVKTDRRQAEDRCHRKGMRDKLTIIDLVMKETVDEDVLVAFRSWTSVTVALLGHLGVDIGRFVSMSGERAEEPVIVDHVMQKKGECALAAIAMLAGKEYELVRSYMTVQLGSSKAYSGTHDQILIAVEKFVPALKGQWNDYISNSAGARTSQKENEIPTTGNGVLLLRHVKSPKIGHAVAYDNGTLHDPGKPNGVSIEEYKKWMVASQYLVDWVFTV